LLLYQNPSKTANSSIVANALRYKDSTTRDHPRRSLVKMAAATDKTGRPGGQVFGNTGTGQTRKTG
jgi:ribosomal protein L35AE/L33A